MSEKFILTQLKHKKLVQRVASDFSNFQGLVTEKVFLNSSMV